jgi:hypothetical protein
MERKLRMKESGRWQSRPNGPPDERRWKELKERWKPRCTKGHMVNEVESNLAMQSPGSEVRPKLPEAVIRIHSSLPILPKPRPAWEVEVHPVCIRQGFFGQCLFYRLAIIGPRDHPNLMEASNLAHPVPSDRRLRALPWFTGISGKQDSHCSPHANVFPPSKTRVRRPRQVLLSASPFADTLCPSRHRYQLRTSTT